jgi:hypothetical protein
MTFFRRGCAIIPTRIFTLVLLVQLFGLATPAVADPITDSRRLYVSLNAYRAALMDLLALRAAEPRVTADLIKKYVYTPTNVAGSLWIDRSISEGQERYRPFSGCLNAATALSDLSSRIILSSGGPDLTIVGAAAHLREAITGCEFALDHSQRAPQMGSRSISD